MEDGGQGVEVEREERQRNMHAHTHFFNTLEEMIYRLHNSTTFFLGLAKRELTLLENS